MKTKSILTMILTLGLCAGAASAKGGGKHAGGHASKFDTNSDGLISLEEFSAKCKKPEKAKARFEKADANHDGQIDKTELATLKKHGGGKHKGGKNKGGK